FTHDRGLRAVSETGAVRELWVERLGLVPYGRALEMQREIARQRIAGTLEQDVLLLLEHPPVITMGRSAKEQNVLASSALLQALGGVGIPAERTAGYTGVWTRGRKIASIGVHARDWVTWHGFALNVSTDLSYFDLMVPCGIQSVTMTSVERELGAPMTIAQVS